MAAKAPDPYAPVSRLDLKANYSRFVGLLKLLDDPEPLQTAVGGEFEAFGIIEREMLRFFGLKPDHMLIDVGCGSGRLAIPLSGDHPGGYLGTDLVQELLDYAQRRCARPDWRFAAVDRIAIPAEDGQADMVAFFSVLTHLLHEHSFLYLQEARRVLKPGGRVVLSFLEYAEPTHWPVFDSSVVDVRTHDAHPLNVFIERPAIEMWSRRLGLAIVEFRGGTEAFVPLPEPIRLESGEMMAGLGWLGQSICVLERSG